MTEKHPCPCCSGLEYETCCQSFHEGKFPENALQLMRSRFSAYALNLPEYIMETTHRGNPQYSENKDFWKKSISAFSEAVAFHKLEILDFNEKGTTATVTFIAYLSQDGQDETFTEKSEFEKLGDKWLYLRGQLTKGACHEMFKQN